MTTTYTRISANQAGALRTIYAAAAAGEGSVDSSDIANALGYASAMATVRSLIRRGLAEEVGPDYAPRYLITDAGCEALGHPVDKPDRGTIDRILDRLAVGTAPQWCLVGMRDRLSRLVDAAHSAAIVEDGARACAICNRPASELIHYEPGPRFHRPQIARLA